MSVAYAAVAFGDLHIVDRQRWRRQRIQRRSKGEAKHQVVEIPMPASVGFLPGQGLAVLLGQEMAEAIAVGGGIREEHRLLCALPLQHIGTGAVVHQIPAQPNSRRQRHAGGDQLGSRGHHHLVAAAPQCRLQIPPISRLQAIDRAIRSIHPVVAEFVFQQRALAHRLDPQIHRLPLASW